MHSYVSIANNPHPAFDIIEATIEPSLGTSFDEDLPHAVNLLTDVIGDGSHII
jgi:hypothetical protein